MWVTAQGSGPISSAARFLPGEHGRNALHPTRRVDVDRYDARMGMRRADDDAVQRVRRREIVDVTPVSPHEAFVFQAIDAAPQ